MAKSKQEQQNTAPQVTARLRHFRMSPRKMRLVVDVVRGQLVHDAVTRLTFTDKKAALPIKKLILSAVASAKSQGMEEADLVVEKIFVDGGPLLKRSMPRAHGRASAIRKPTSHITLVLSKKEKEQLTK